MLDHLPLLSIPIILELYMSKINKKTHVVNLPYLITPLSPPFFSVLYGLRLVRAAAIKTDYELISFFSFIPTFSVTPQMINWPPVLPFLLPFIDSFTMSPPAAANPFLPSRPWSASVRIKGVVS